MDEAAYSGFRQAWGRAGWKWWTITMTNGDAYTAKVSTLPPWESVTKLAIDIVCSDGTSRAIAADMVQAIVRLPLETELALAYQLRFGEPPAPRILSGGVMGGYWAEIDPPSGSTLKGYGPTRDLAVENLCKQLHNGPVI